MNEQKTKLSRGYRQGSSQIKTKVGSKDGSFHIAAINDSLVPSSKTMALNKIMNQHTTPKIPDSI